mgnify:CR=1 FL=1
MEAPIVPSLNIAMVMGRLVDDPAFKYSPSGIPVCSFHLAAEKRVTQADGVPARKIVFLEVVAWRRLAEISAQFLKKGREVFVCGELAQKRANAEGRPSRIRIQAASIQFIGAPRTEPSEDAAPPSVAEEEAV